MDSGCVEQWTGSKSGKEYVKAVYCHPADLTFMQSTSCEMLGWMKQKLESRLLGEISITSDTQMTPTLWQKVQSREGVCFWERAAVATGRGLALSSKAPDPGDGTGDAVEMKDVQQTVWPKDAASQMPALTCTAAPALSGEGYGSPVYFSCLDNPHGQKSLAGLPFPSPMHETEK